MTTQERANDARRLSPDSQEELRRRVVAAVNNGMTQGEAADVFGVSRRSVGLWIHRHHVAGPDGLRAHRRGRAPGTQHALTRRTQAQLLQEMAAGPPERLGLDGVLWSRRALITLILSRTGWAMSPTTLNRYLARWGIAPSQRPGSPSMSAGRRVWTLSWERPVPRFAGDELVPGPGAFAAVPTPGRCGPPPPFLEALMAESGRGELFFSLAPKPYRSVDLLDFGQRLVRCLGPGVQLAVRNWPAEHTDELRTWATHLGPGLCLTPWRRAAITPTPDPETGFPRRSDQT